MASVEFSRYKRLIQYFWDPEPVNKSTQVSIWCLGKEYKTESNFLSVKNSINSLLSVSNSVSSNCIRPASQSTSPSNFIDQDQTSHEFGNEDIGLWPIEFLDDFETRISLTYRSGFPTISRCQDSKTAPSLSLPLRLRNQLIDVGAFTSDIGWGCMIRSGQSLLANTLALLRLGRDWRRGSENAEERKIISLFADDPKAPFSIHNFVEHGTTACGKYPGEWFGPSATARCIQALTTKYEPSNLNVYVTEDGSEVYEDNFMAVAKSDELKFKPTLILIATRLGLEKITPVYWDALKFSLQMPQTVGIAGGHPSSSHYFVGVQDCHFFYLDPHQTQPALNYFDDVNRYTKEDIDSCHTRRLRRAHIKEMDPSMLIAFLIRTEHEWKEWRELTQNFQGKAIIRVADVDPILSGHGNKRNEAVDEVETFDDEDDL